MNTDSCRPSGMIERPATSKTPVVQAITTLDSAVDYLGNGLNELYTRLEPVLSQLPGKPSQPPSSVQDGNSAMVEKLLQITHRIEIMNEALSNIRARLEV